MPVDAESDRVVKLQEIRDALWSAWHDPVATLGMRATAAKELRAIDVELARCAVPSEVPFVDELAQRAAVGGAGTVRPITAARRGQPRRRGGGNRTS